MRHLGGVLSQQGRDGSRERRKGTPPAMVGGWGKTKGPGEQLGRGRGSTPREQSGTAGASQGREGLVERLPGAVP